MITKEFPIRPSEAFAKYSHEIGHIVEAHQGSEPKLFGSTARGEDIDALSQPHVISPEAKFHNP